MNIDKLLDMLLEAIDYSFLQTDGSYCNSLTYPVIDKVKYIKKQLNDNKVKEVDLEKEARHYLLHEHSSPLNEIMHQADLKAEIQYHEDIENAYKAGFELGLKAQKGE